MFEYFFPSVNTFDSAGESRSLDLQCALEEPPPCPPCSLVYEDSEEKIELDTIQMLFDPIAYQESFAWYIFHCNVVKNLTVP